jgi:uncharacterized membrane protein
MWIVAAPGWAEACSVEAAVEQRAAFSAESPLVLQGIVLWHVSGHQIHIATVRIVAAPGRTIARTKSFMNQREAFLAESPLFLFSHVNSSLAPPWASG